MDSVKFQEAQQAYDTGDYRAAAKHYLAAAGKGSVGNGAAYHMAGNALMRLRRHSDAVTVYGHGLRDETYERRGALYANLGAAYAAMGELSQAIAAYESALVEPGYPVPYKAWQGIGSAHMERGHAEDAAIAYRKAALDESNPNPGKALVNLGLCFMALNRPSDAADAYKAALGFDTYTARGRALANLGLAFVAMGEYSEAVKAFEKAIQLHGYELSAVAREAFESAKDQVAPKREVVEGWQTGETPPVVTPIENAQWSQVSEEQGWSTGDLASLQRSGPLPSLATADFSAPAPLAAVADDADRAAADLGFGDDAAVADFFSRTEDEMKKRDREVRRAQRGRGGFLRAFITTVVIAGLLAAAGVSAYFFGLGWPLQTTTVTGLFSAYAAGEPVEPYWVAVPGTDVKREMAKVPPVKSFVIEGVERGRDVSTVLVTVTPQKGGEMRYLVTLGREGVGWRVTGVEYNWRSTGG